MTCNRTVLSTDPPVVIWECSAMEEAWHRHMAAASEPTEQEWAEYEVELTRAEDATLFDREPDFWSYRAATDPYWPPPEVDPFEQVRHA